MAGLLTVAKIALALAATWSLATAAAAQTAPSVPGQDQATDLADIVVEGRDLGEATRDFVGEIAAPVRGRGLARWQGRVCVGVISLEGEAAQYIVDRVSTVAEDLGLRPGDAGCTPNVVVIATDDGQTMARALVQSRPREFDTNVSGANRSDAALEDFQNSDRLIRWWHVSLPVDSETGDPAVRIPGQAGGDGSSTMDYAPSISVFSASRLNSQIRDELRQVIVVLDIDALDQASFEQISDYIAMVALAQVDPEAETGQFNTILNIFDPTVAADRFLTSWDTAYLRGLYGAEQNEIGTRRNAGAVAAAMAGERLTMPEAN
jgi:hypothetical protein